MRDKTKETIKYKYEYKYLYMILLTVILIMFVVSTPAIETQEVELGHGGVYDGAVSIGRDDAGRLIFYDQELGTTVTLGDLYNRGEDHGLLLGLADNDHPQYMLHTELDSLPELESIIGGVDLVSKTEGDGQYFRLDGGNSPLLGDALNHRIGLGTALPNALLHLYGSDARLRLQDDDSSYSYFDIDDGSRTQTVFNKVSDGIESLIDFNPIATNGTGKAAFRFFRQTNTIGERGIYIHNGDGSAGLSAYLSAGGGSSYFNASGGNVGIGTVAPAAKLEVVGGDIRLGNGNRLEWAGDEPSIKAQGGLMTVSALTSVRILGDTDANDAADSEMFGVYRTDEGSSLISVDREGDLTITGDLDLTGSSSRLKLAGKPVVMGANLLDNPDFCFWQRNISQTCAAGGDAEGTITYPQPGTLVTGADRWQISRSGTSMSTLVTRETPPTGLSTAAWCLKQTAVSGTPCEQYLFQAVPRDVTVPLRGGWVTFAISHYLAGGSDGGTIAIYKTVSGTVTQLTEYSFESTPNTWERVAIAAQVPDDAETLLVSIQSNLSLGGSTVSYIANATLLAGRYVSAPEIVSSLPLSSMPPVSKPISADLASCQAFFEKGSIRLTGYSPDNNINVHATMVHFNTAKMGVPAITISNLFAPQLASPNFMTYEKPVFSECRDLPQGFRFEISGVTSSGMMIGVTADWNAECEEPI